MTEPEFDLFVIGAGSGGVRAARVAAKLGARVAICEAGAFGGTCVNAGCIPKKLFVYGAEVSTELEDAKGYGWSFGDVSFSWTDLLRNKDAEIARLGGVYRRLLENAGVTVIIGRGRFLDPHTIAVGERRFTAENVLVATGGHPHRPDIPGAELGITSDDVFHLEKLPKHLIVIGGGYVALELAGVFRGFGVETHLVHRGERLLRHFDHDVAHSVADDLVARGISVHLSREVTALERRSERIAAVLEDGSALETDLVLHATGRRPNLVGLGLDAIGVAVDANGAIPVDANYRTSVPNVFAVGDVIGHLALTPVALAEGKRVAHLLFGTPLAPLDYDRVPTAVFSQPEISTVGLTEEEARRRGHTLAIYRTAYRPLKLTMTQRTERTMMKLVVDATTDRVLGCHVVAHGAAEIVQGFAVAITCGATKAQLDATIGIHPTAAEELVTMLEAVPS